MATMGQKLPWDLELQSWGESSHHLRWVSPDMGINRDTDVGCNEIWALTCHRTQERMQGAILAKVWGMVPRSSMTESVPCNSAGNADSMKTGRGKATGPQTLVHGTVTRGRWLNVQTSFPLHVSNCSINLKWGLHWWLWPGSDKWWCFVGYHEWLKATDGF